VADPIILDTFSPRPQLKIYTKLNLWEKRVQYIGPVIDTITIKHIIDPYEVIKNHSVYPEDEDTLMSKNYSSCQHEKLDIQVNTKKYFPLETYFRRFHHNHAGGKSIRTKKENLFQ